MARFFTASLLALLMANPLCCCADLLADVAPSKSARHACCADAADNTPTAPPASSPCPCTKLPRILVGQSTVEPPAPTPHPKDPAPWLVASFLDLSDQRFPATRILQHSGTHPPPAAAPSLMVLYGVFRC